MSLLLALTLPSLFLALCSTEWAQENLPAEQLVVLVTPDCATTEKVEKMAAILTEHSFDVRDTRSDVSGIGNGQKEQGEESYIIARTTHSGLRGEEGEEPCTIARIKEAVRGRREPLS